MASESPSVLLAGGAGRNAECKAGRSASLVAAAVGGEGESKRWQRTKEVARRMVVGGGGGGEDEEGGAREEAAAE